MMAKKMDPSSWIEDKRVKKPKANSESIQEYKQMKLQFYKNSKSKKTFSVETEAPLSVTKTIRRNLTDQSKDKKKLKEFLENLRAHQSDQQENQRQSESSNATDEALRGATSTSQLLQTTPRDSFELMEDKNFCRVDSRVNGYDAIVLKRELKLLNSNLRFSIHYNESNFPQTKSKPCTLKNKLLSRCCFCRLGKSRRQCDSPLIWHKPLS